MKFLDDLATYWGAARAWWGRRRRIVIFSLAGIGILTVLATVGIAGGMAYVLMRYGPELPDYRQLADYEPPVITRIHAGDGTLLKEYARQRRLFVPIEAIPQDLIHAFLAAEDKNFYEHGGVDYMGIVRAAITNLMNSFSNKRKVGGSTITQQVAKNFLLSNEVSYERKIKEAILAFRIERAYEKDQILELYMNDSYLGYGAYGVAAGALIYFDKSLDELEINEMAYLAAVLKFPGNENPERRLERRNWIIDRMEDIGYISDEVAATEREKAVELRQRQFASQVYHADHFAEEVRRELYELYGGKNLYEGGLSARTTLEPQLQAIAERALRDGLIAYDRRHGWRGALGTIDLESGAFALPSEEGEAGADSEEAVDEVIASDSENSENDAGDGEGGVAAWAAALGGIEIPLGVDAWRLAVVLDVRDSGAVIGFQDGSLGWIPEGEVTWAQAWLEKEMLGPQIKNTAEVLSVGDVVPVENLHDAERTTSLTGIKDGHDKDPGIVDAFGLRQVPAIEGALVAMDPHTGRVLAMVGGWDFDRSEFNRATQAKRQPGSAFKPIVYAAALDSGFTPSSLILDAPFVMDQGEGQGKWKPGNSTNKFYGPSTLRTGLEMSRNLMTVRLAQYIGMDKVVEYAERFGVGDNMEPTLAMALGSGEVSLLELTTAYAMFVNGGKRVTPILIDRIQDRRGHTIFRHDERTCQGCLVADWRASGEPQIPDERVQILDERTAYQVVSMMKGVVDRGTGRRIRELGKPLGGKTGTTNDWVDAWFIGFSADLVVGVFTGFDQPRSLGVREEGSAVAAPIFKQFMGEALKNRPSIPFRIPAGLRMVRVNARTGQPAGDEGGPVILEAFLPGTEPNGEMLVLDGAEGFMQTDDKLRRGTGGLY